MGCGPAPLRPAEKLGVGAGPLGSTSRTNPMPSGAHPGGGGEAALWRTTAVAALNGATVRPSLHAVEKAISTICAAGLGGPVPRRAQEPPMAKD